MEDFLNWNFFVRCSVSVLALAVLVHEIMAMYPAPRVNFVTIFVPPVMFVATFMFIAAIIGEHDIAYIIAFLVVVACCILLRSFSKN